MRRNRHIMNEHHRVAYLATLAMTALACSEEGGLATLRPRMELSPAPGTELRFDEVILTRTQVGPREIVVRNVGDGVLTLSSVQLEGADASSFVLSDAIGLLAPGEAGEIYVRFEPKTPGQKQAVLRILSNDSERSDVSYPLVGPAREPCVLAASENYLAFSVGEVREVSFTSLSTHECVIDRVFVDRDVFPIVEEPELPLIVAPGGSAILRIEHRPVSDRASGVPVRELLVRESEGGELLVLLEGEPPLYGCLSAFPLEISFPQTSVGETRRQRVTVSNRCGRQAAISSVTVSRGWGVFEVEGQYPAFLAPGGRVDVWIRYLPQTEFDLGRITINTNDSATPQFRVRVQGEAALPDIEAFPPLLDFGTVIHRDPSGMAQRSECASAARFVQIYSTGSAPLTISRLEIENARDEYFEVTGVTVDGTVVSNFGAPFSIPIGKAAMFSLQFFPGRAVPTAHESALLIHHNGRSGGPTRIRLEGTATADGPVTDTFTQLEGPKVDILWVVDDSCSMYDEQARLIGNLSQFISYADSLHADYQMGVVVTDSRSPDAGKLEFCYPHPPIVKHDYALREEAFRCLFDVGVTGSGIEAGLGAAMRALQRAQLVDGDPIRNPNIGFLRDDATLAVVIMSDEEDQSLESDDLLRDFFNSVHGPGRTSVHAIAGPVGEPCQTMQAASGYRYHWMAQQTNGLFQNICLEDWQPVLRNLGLNVFQPLDGWDLSQAADPASISVTVDGRPVVWNATSGYTYNASTNRLSFHGTAIPGPGQQIVVQYLGNCRP